MVYEVRKNERKKERKKEKRKKKKKKRNERQRDRQKVTNQCIYTVTLNKLKSIGYIYL